jgi:hypothetical protein
MTSALLVRRSLFVLLPFSLAWTLRSSSPRRPPTISRRFHPLLGLGPLRSLLTPPGRSSLLLATPSPEVPSPSALPSGSPHRTGLPLPLCSAFRFSQPLDGLLLPGSRGLFSCPSRSWGSPFRAFPSAAAVPPLDGLLPSCRSPGSTSAPKSSGLPAVSPSGLSSAAESVAAAGGLDPRPARCSPGLFPL